MDMTDVYKKEIRRLSYKSFAWSLEECKLWYIFSLLELYLPLKVCAFDNGTATFESNSGLHAGRSFSVTKFLYWCVKSSNSSGTGLESLWTVYFSGKLILKFLFLLGGKTTYAWEIPSRLDGVYIGLVILFALTGIVFAVVIFITRSESIVTYSESEHDEEESE